MFSNAVTSAVGRLYASAAAEAPRLQPQVQRVEPVSKVAPGAAGAPADHGQPDQKAQRHALADGVRAVFESVGSSDLDPQVAETDELASISAASEEPAPAPSGPPDPMLEEAILRFIHSVFRGIAEAESAGGAPDALSWDGKIDPVGQRQAAAHLPGASASREQLGRRIGSLAETLAAGGAGSDPLAADGVRAGEIGETFTGVLEALGGHADVHSTPHPTRGDLVALMHRLAQAMQGSPPIDAGLPTVGGLLHAQA